MTSSKELELHVRSAWPQKFNLDMALLSADQRICCVLLENADACCGVGLRRKCPRLLRMPILPPRVTDLRVFKEIDWRKLLGFLAPMKVNIKVLLALRSI